MIGSPGTKAAPGVSFGVQGYVEALPPAFSQAVVLLGRKGISATQMAWGETVRRHAGTKRLTLDKDILNSKVTYWTDNASTRPPFFYPCPPFSRCFAIFRVRTTATATRSARTRTAACRCTSSSSPSRSTTRSGDDG